MAYGSAILAINGEQVLVLKSEGEIPAQAYQIFDTVRAPHPGIYRWDGDRWVDRGVNPPVLNWVGNLRPATPKDLWKLGLIDAPKQPFPGGSLANIPMARGKEEYGDGDHGAVPIRSWKRPSGDTHSDGVQGPGSGAGG